MMLGSDCVAYIAPLVPCAEPATFVRLDGDGRPVAVLCANHAETTDRPIAATVERAPRSDRLMELAAEYRDRLRRNG